MKKINLNILLFIFVTTLITSCVKDDDYVTPTVKDYIFFEDFAGDPLGSGSNEIPVNLENWINFNINGTTKVWHSRTANYNGDVYKEHAQFSSFYSSSSSEQDEVWLISPEFDSNAMFSFINAKDFDNGDVLKAFVTTDFDGTTAGIATATWQELEINLPDGNDNYVDGGDFDLSIYNSPKVRVAFKYTGKKTGGPTTTCFIDNISIYKK